MRIAALALLSALAVTVLPLAANAVPNGPSVPTVGSGQGLELVAGSSPNAEQQSRRPEAHHSYSSRYWHHHRHLGSWNR